VFFFVAFWGIFPIEMLAGTIVVQAVAKIGYEIVATPGTYAVVGWLKRAEGIDHYDRETRFNPFAVSRLSD